MNDTIVALATGSLPSAIALIRVSGPKVPELIRLHTSGSHEPRTFVYTRLTHKNHVIDDVMSVYFAAPKSFTSEDVWEISAHGSKIGIKKIIDALISHENVRLAEPGEFTRRAVDSGKLDLLQAEAIADLIAAESPGQHDLALGHLNGKFSAVCDQWQTQLLDILANIEALIDFPDESDVSIHLSELERKVSHLVCEAKFVLQNCEIGTTIRDGLSIAIVGPTNAGKSSLFNYFLNDDRSIVTDIAGTTRDYVDATLVLAGQTVRLIDTAGLRDSEDAVERLGIEKGKSEAASADICLNLRPITDTQEQCIDNLGPKNINVITKADLVDNVDVSRETLCISLVDNTGLDELKTIITTKITELTTSLEPPLITRQRHKDCIQSALTYLDAAKIGLLNQVSAEIIAEDIREAILHLRALIGQIDSEEVLGQIFGEFCIGK